MKITKRQLQRIIKEEVQRKLISEADTDVYEGDHDPVTVEIPALETHATMENFDGEKVWFSSSDALGIANALEDGEPNIERFSYDEDRYNEAKEIWEKLTDTLEGFDQEDREELSDNIRSAVKRAEDAGYGY
jgi:hypothetical protein